MKKINKTNAARLLDRAKVPYELVPYEVDENNNRLRILRFVSQGYLI